MSTLMDQEYPIIIPYKIDRSVENTGRHLAITKRHYHCQFGFAHIPSILQGEAGAGCRGIEMDIHVIWSIASGKREIHFNKTLLYHDVVPNRGVQRFDHTFTIPEFTLPGGHIIHITALTFAFSEAEQFVVTVNGQSYEEFLSIYELGGARMYEIYGVLLDNYSRYRQGAKPLQLAAQQDNIPDRAKYLPVPEEGKIKDAKNYSMRPMSKREERKMFAIATEQSLQDNSTMDRLHHSTLERLSSIRSYRPDVNEKVVEHPQPQASLSFQPDMDLLGLRSDTGTVKPSPIVRETPEQMLLSFPDNYSSHANSFSERKRPELHSSSFSVPTSGHDTPLMYAAPPPAWETLQSDFSYSFASPPSRPVAETKSYHPF